MQNPILVKDAYNNIMARLYQRVHPGKNKWLCRTLYPPVGYGGYKTVALQQAFVGPVYEGLDIDYVDYGTSLWAKKTTGAAWSTGGGAPVYCKSTTKKGNYSDFAVPDGHNIIHALLYNNTSGGCSSVVFSWDDDSTGGISVNGGGTNTYNQKSSAYVVELSVCTGTKPAGKKLRITHDGTDGTETLRVVGVKSWNTGVAGDPSTNVGGVATGHAQLIESGLLSLAGNYARNQSVISGAADTYEITALNSHSAHLFAVNWSPYKAAVNPSGAAVDKGGGTVGIPCAGHGFAAGDKITIAGCTGGGTSYNASWTITSQTTNEIVITKTYAAYTFAGTETIVYAQRYSGDNNHYGTDQAEFLWAVGSAEATEGPEIFVDGTSAGHLWNVSDIALKEVQTGTNIALNGVGFLDFNRDGAQGASDPTVTFALSFSKNKMSVNAAIAWAADSYAPVVYPMMWSPSSPSTILVKNIPDYEETAFADYEEYGVNELVAYIPAAQVNVIFTHNQTPDYANVSSSKLYMRAESNAMPGGDHPGSGDVLLLSGSMSVQSDEIAISNHHRSAAPVSLMPSLLGEF